MSDQALRSRLLDDCALTFLSGQGDADAGDNTPEKPIKKMTEKQVEALKKKHGECQSPVRQVHLGHQRAQARATAGAVSICSSICAYTHPEGNSGKGPFE